MPLINNKGYSYDAKGFKKYKEDREACTGRPTGQGYGAARKGPAATGDSIRFDTVVVDNKEYDYSV
jgi:hypothetical protein|tara:strand:- start:74 stop:271 length:198 start_codon:yes stop_codon:yes gene_type:complete